MLKDITIGQYFPGESFVHKLDPRMKIVLTIAYVVMLFLTNNVYGFIISVGFLVLSYSISRISFKMILKSLKPIVPIILFTAILNLFFVNGDPLFKWWVISISAQGVKLAVFMSLRVIFLIAGTSLLTYTTSPIELTDGIELLLSPLKKVKFPVHELAMMMTIALRFIPTLIEETDKIMSAQKARGADLESGGIVQRAKALIPILIPLFISAFRRAEELALAMECRCYHGDEGRTRMKQLQYSWRDAFSFILISVLIITVILINMFIKTGSF
ncbi:MAG: transporter rane component [Oscillospiraceae bacterium]|nr:transporter rane component [Oscillospiraceae bacterium]